MANQKKVKLQGFKFQPFSQKQLKILTCWQDNSPVKNKFLIIADGSIRSGKEQPLSAKLYTPNGYKLMGDIQIGDYVFSRKGKKTQVLGIFPQGKKDVYELVFSDNSSTRCGKEHLWTYRTKSGALVTTSLADILEDFIENPRSSGIFEDKYRFPINGCVIYEQQEVDIEPYLYGLLLGDSCLDKQNHEVTYYGNENCAVAYTIPNECYKDIDVASIKDKGILDEYKYNSKKIRYSTLAGLLAVNGKVINEHTVAFYTLSEELLDDTAELARSLGLYVTVNKDDYRCYELTINVTESLYKHLPFGYMRNIVPNRQVQFRTIKSINLVGQEDCQCIYVDNEEHLYLTDDFIVTHNTVCMALSFVLFVMTHFNHQNAAMCGKSVGSFRRNVLATMKQMMLSIGYEVIEHRSENYVEITNGDVVNYFFIFGGKDESSQDLINLCRA